MAKAMLIMLPKFALVVIEMFFSVLAKVRLPSSTPGAARQIAALSRMMSALSRATSTASATEIPTSGRVQGRCVVDAVPQVADGMAGALQGTDDALFLLGVDFDEKVGAGCRVPQCSSRIPARSSPVSIDVPSSPTTSAICAVTWRLSPLITLIAMPSRARFRSFSRASGFGGSRKTRKPRNTMSVHLRGHSPAWQ